MTLLLCFTQLDVVFSQNRNDNQRTIYFRSNLSNRKYTKAEDWNENKSYTTYVVFFCSLLFFTFFCFFVLINGKIWVYFSATVQEQIRRCAKFIELALSSIGNELRILRCTNCILSVRNKPLLYHYYHYSSDFKIGNCNTHTRLSATTILLLGK
jgi:hypothetical protein